MISLKPSIFGSGLSDAHDSSSSASHDRGFLNNSPNVLYVGDSLFADLVDAKREFGWTTAAIISELKEEVEFSTDFEAVKVKRTIATLLEVMRKIQVSSSPTTTGLNR